MQVAKDWECPACGSGLEAKATDCCDYCILTIYSGKHSPELSVAFSKYSSTADYVNDPTDYEEV